MRCDHARLKRRYVVFWGWVVLRCWPTGSDKRVRRSFFSHRMKIVLMLRCFIRTDVISRVFRREILQRQEEFPEYHSGCFNDCSPGQVRTWLRIQRWFTHHGESQASPEHDLWKKWNPGPDTRNIRRVHLCTALHATGLDKALVWPIVFPRSSSTTRHRPEYTSKGAYYEHRTW